jgi:hypothetical protein
MGKTFSVSAKMVKEREPRNTRIKEPQEYFPIALFHFCVFRTAILKSFVFLATFSGRLVLAQRRRDRGGKKKK